MGTASGPEPFRAAAHHNLRAIFARVGFRRLLAARLASQLADGLFQAGLAGSVFFNPQRAADPVAIALAFAVLLVPYSTLGPFVGVFLDRWSRRQVLFLANLARAGLVLPAAYLVWYGNERLVFVLIALLIIALNRFFLAGMSAAQPHVADADRLVTANSLATTAGSVCYALALGVSGAVFHRVGTGYHQYAVGAGAAALLYAGSAIVTLVSFRADELGPDDAEHPHGSVWSALIGTARGMVAGVIHLSQRPVAASALTAQAVQRGLYGVLAIMTLLLYRNYFYPGNPAGSVAGLLPVAAAGALGALVAAVATPAAARRIGGRGWLVLLFAVLAVSVPGLCLWYRPGLTVAAAAVLSLGAQAAKIVSDTALQVECHDDFRGRVFSVNDTAYNLLFVGGLFVGALVLPDSGRAPLAVVVVGVLYAALAAWYGLVAPPQRRLTPASPRADRSADGGVIAR